MCFRLLGRFVVTDIGLPGRQEAFRYGFVLHAAERTCGRRKANLGGGFFAGAQGGHIVEVAEEYGGHGGKWYGQECANDIKERAADRHGDQHHHRVQIDGFGLQQG